MGWVWWIWMGCSGCPSSDPNPDPLPVDDPSPAADGAHRPAPFGKSDGQTVGCALRSVRMADHGDS